VTEDSEVKHQRSLITLENGGGKLVYT